MYAQSYATSPLPSFRIYSSTQKVNSYPFVVTPISTTLTLKQPLIYFVFMSCIFWPFHINGVLSNSGIIWKTDIWIKQMEIKTPTLLLDLSLTFARSVFIKGICPSLPLLPTCPTKSVTKPNQERESYHSPPTYHAIVQRQSSVEKNIVFNGKFLPKIYGQERGLPAKMEV